MSLAAVQQSFILRYLNREYNAIAYNRARVSLQRHPKHAFLTLCYRDDGGVQRSMYLITFKLPCTLHFPSFMLLSSSSTVGSCVLYSRSLQYILIHMLDRSRSPLMLNIQLVIFAKQISVRKSIQDLVLIVYIYTYIHACRYMHINLVCQECQIFMFI